MSADTRLLRLRDVVSMRILSALPSSANKNCVHFPSSCISVWVIGSFGVSLLQTTVTQIKLSCLLQLATPTTLYEQTSSMDTALSMLHQLNLLNSTHCTQWSTMSCTHSSLDCYSVKVKKYTTVTSTDPKPLFNNINFS